MSPGRSSEAGGLGGPGRDLAARPADLVGSVRGGRRGAAVSAFWAWLGWGPAMREGVWVGVRGGKQFTWAAFRGRGVCSLGSGGVCGGRLRVTGRAGCAAGRGARCGGCVRVTGWGAGGEGQGRGFRGGVCCVGVCVRLQRRTCVVSCRLGGLEEKLAVFCGRGKDFADERAYLVHLLVSGGKRVL